MCVSFLYYFQGDLLKTIAEHTKSNLPDVCHLTIEGWHHIQDRSIHGLFEAFPLDERRNKERDGRQVAGRRPKRVGHGGGRGGARSIRHRGDRGVVDQVVPITQEEGDIDATYLGNDNDNVLHEGNHEAGRAFKVEEPDVQPARDITDDLEPFLGDPSCDILTSSDERNLVQHVSEPISSYPTFNLGLTPDGSLLPSQQPTNQHIKQPTHKSGPQHTQQPISSYPTFDLGITPVDDGNVGNSILSMQSPQVPVKQVVSNPSNIINPTNLSGGDRYRQVYEPRRLKRLHKSTKCGTGGHKIIKRP